MVDFFNYSAYNKSRQRKRSGAENSRRLCICVSVFHRLTVPVAKQETVKRLFYLLVISKLFSSLNFPTAQRMNPARVFPLNFITASISASSVGLNFVVQVIRSPLVRFSVFFVGGFLCFTSCHNLALLDFERNSTIRQSRYRFGVESVSVCKFE